MVALKYGYWILAILTIMLCMFTVREVSYLNHLTDSSSKLLTWMDIFERRLEKKTKETVSSKVEKLKKLNKRKLKYKTREASQTSQVEEIRKKEEHAKNVQIRKYIMKTFHLSVVNGKSTETEEIKLLILPYIINGNFNKAQFRNDLECTERNKHNKENGKFVLVTNVIALNESLVQIFNRTPNKEMLAARELEILNVVQANLNHNLIKSIAVLVEDRTVLNILRKIDFENSDKMIIQSSNGMLKMSDTFEYATKCFRDEVVVIGNQDNIIGKGWDLLDTAYLRKTKLMYALTRHPSILNPSCKSNSKYGICGINYGMSNDAFVFHVKELIPKTSFSYLNSNIFNAYGVENIVIWTFRKTLNYKVTNPCSILQLHHEHCISIRNKRKRVGNSSVWNVANFANTLY